MKAFSLTEILVALCVLATGMLMAAIVFPVAIHLHTEAAERTIASVVADEAFAKVQIFRINKDAQAFYETNRLQDFRKVHAYKNPRNEPIIDLDEFFYPSVDGVAIQQKQYCWLALCQRPYEPTGQRPTWAATSQVTVIVCRTSPPGILPQLEYVGITVEADPTKIRVNNPDHAKFFPDGTTVVSAINGSFYRVLERPRNDPTVLILNREWEGPPSLVGVINSGGQRVRCIGVYQKIIKLQKPREL